jgi:ABC-type lipoprotein export system ATPase subunit
VTLAVDARDLFHVYSSPEGEAAALQGLSLAVREGESLVVLGPSGSGKSTLLRILAGLERPSAGSLRVFGADVPRGRRAAYRARVLGYVEQHYTLALDPDLTARELVALQLALDGAPRRPRLARADELLERAGLAGKADARPPELSGGEQQRVAVCAALAHRPRLLLADEPTGELDTANAARVYELIAELTREHGCTTVVVSHDPGSAAAADRVVHVRDGRVSEEAAGGEESLVVARGGWLRIPEELLARAGIGTRARARLEGAAIVVEGTGRTRAPAPSAAPASARNGGATAAEVRSLTRAFGRSAVLDRLSATFRAGRMTAVTGPSGSGKTTLLRLLAGLDRPTGGDVEILGVPIAVLDRPARADFRREKVAIVAQQPALVPFLSARENVELGLELRRVGEAEERAVAALDAVGLGERREHRVSRLSAGERQRVAIARALAVRAPLVLADEPTARLDGANALAVASLFARLAREHGTAVVCATHDPLVVEAADDELPLA